MSTSVIDAVLAEHAEEASFLWLQRTTAVHAPNYSPKQFADLDERLEAHVDGLRVAGEDGWKLVEATLENGDPEDFFAASVLAIEATDNRFEAVVARAQETPEVAPGVISALGWVEPKFLGGRVKALLSASTPFQQVLGLAACAVHRRDPGGVLDRFLDSPAAAVRSRALRTSGEVGRTDLLTRLSNRLAETKDDARFWAARSAVLLGNRTKALDELAGRALKPGRRQMQSLQLALQAMEMEAGHEVLLQFAEVPDAERLRIIGAGLAGNVRYVPWLIDRMAHAPLARVAGESFVNITGADFNLDQLETPPPADFEEGPTEDPADEDVQVPEDVALPWPNIEQIEAWWERNRSRFSPSTRYFLGVPLSRDCCRQVLRTGFQRQRVLAAHYLTLLEPGTPLFNTGAPAGRQQKLLAQMA